jgi:predicted metal-dependent HD superfamily phosphohydrolase
METAWRDLWSRLNATGDPGPVYADLGRRYAEPHRAYHTMAHISHCLDEFQAARSLAREPDAVELALWFHDAIYDTHASDSEERSADLVRRLGREASLAPAVTDRAVAFILASTHREPPRDPDTRLFVDVDLAILGQPWERFAAYEQEVRREYEWVPSWLFRRKRAKVLKSFLARPTLYGTSFFRKRYERPARENIARSLGLAGRS